MEAAQGMSGERAVGGRGHDAGQTANKADSEPDGSRTPSWTTRAGAAVDNEWGGRTPDLDHGELGGSAGGQRDGEGHLLGLWNGPIDIGASVAIAVNAALVLLDADMSDLGKKLLGKAVRGLGGKQLRKELAGELGRVVDARMPDIDKQLAADAGYQAMSRADKKAVRARARERLEREAHARARAYFADQAERSEATVRALAGKTDDMASHERELATANARAYRDLERAAADKGGLEAADSSAILACAPGKTEDAGKGLATTVRWKGFSKGSLSTHHAKHGAEFGDITQAQYLGQAKRFAAEQGANFQEAQVGKFMVKYDPATGRVLVGHAGSREIRTFYKADGRSGDPFEAAVELARTLSGH